MSDAADRPPRDPAQIPVEEKRRFFTKLALAGSQELRGLLSMDETHYRKLAIEAHSDARAYFLYSVLDSVYQVGVAMMRWEDLLADGPAPQDDSIEGRLVESSIVAEAAMWVRRLIEMLTTLICFSTTNEQPYYRHYLLLDQLEAFIFKRKDQLDYFACEQKSVLHWIDSTAAEIHELEPELGLERCWYLKGRRTLAAAPRKGVLSGFADRLRTAMPVAKLRERGALGLSYQQFSSVSGLIHFSPGERWFDGEKGDLESRFSQCWLLVQAVLVRVIELAGLKPTGICAQMLATFGQNPTGDDLAAKMTKGRAKVGDFVVVGRSLARIVRVKLSRYDYESYTVKYLADAPAKDVVEDDVMPFHVRLLRDAEALKAKTIDKLRELALKVDDMQPQELDAMLDESFVELWELVLRDHLFGKPSPQAR